MVTYDRTYEYRADFDGHEVAGHVVAVNITQAIDEVRREGHHGWGASHVDVRLLAEVKRTTCCQRGDWSGAAHQPAEAFRYVPHVNKAPFFRGEARTTFLAESTPAYRWTCEYCGKEGTADELNQA